MLWYLAAARLNFKHNGKYLMLDFTISKLLEAADMKQGISSVKQIAVISSKEERITLAD